MESHNDQKSVFLGKVTASVAHDLQNVLAVIKETSGLLQDILLINQSSLPGKFTETFTKNIESVQKQIARGVSITSGLNGFAHTADYRESHVNIENLIQKLIFVTRRIFNHKGFSIEITDCQGEPSILTDPVMLQMLLFEGIVYITDFQSELTALSLKINPETYLTLGISPLENQLSEKAPCDTAGREKAWDNLSHISGALHSEITVNADQRTLIITL
jgi:light-regulated signal transduction histidine kinase (bacteriophytochrome)